ncbi:MAG TPA: hypothetical protein VIN08_22350, partial [Ohtaekwangia sp.]|uniref:hypothetical protein n=1 Tax=Ohtaekwangia sp. TaxID=2066019 RepID=UPI002F94DC43
MTKQALNAFYTSRKNSFSESLASIRKRINLVSNIRLAIALLIILAIYFGLTYYTWLYATLPLLFVFIYLIRVHSKLFDEKTHLENLVNLNDAESKAAAGDSSSFVNGNEFIDPHHPYTHDLDIFGEGSLFQYTNRCNTLGGKQKFANRLSSSLPSATQIYEQQQAIQELASLTDFRQHVQAAGKELEEQPSDRAQLEAWLKQPSFL